MSSNRYFQLSTGVPQVQPLQIDFGLAAESLLRKQKVYDDTAAGMQPYADAVLKTQAIAPDDVSYVKQKSAEVSGLMDSYLNQDLTDPHVQRKLTKDFRAIATDPHLDLISRNTKDYLKKAESLTELENKGQAPISANRLTFTQGINTWMKPGSGGSKAFTTGLPNFYGNVDEPTEKDKYFSQLKDSGFDKYVNDVAGLEGLIFKRGWTGISNSTVADRVGQTFEAYISSPAATQVSRKYDEYLAAGSKPQYNGKELSREEYIKADFINHGLGYVHGKGTIDFDSGLYTALGEEAIRNTNRTDIIPVDVPSSSTKKLHDFGTTTYVGGKYQATSPTTGISMYGEGEVITDPAKQEEYLQKQYETAFDKDEQKSFDAIVRSANLPQNASWREKAKAVSDYEAKRDQFPTAGYTRSSKVFFGDKILDVDIEKDQGILKNMLGRRISTQKVYNIKTGEEVTDQDIKTKMTQAVNKGEAIPAGQIGSDSGMGNFMDKTTKGGTSYRFAEAPIFNYEGEEYVIENNEEFYRTPEGRTAVNVWRNSSNLKEYPEIFFPVVTSAGEEIDNKLQAKYNTDDTYTIKGMKLGNWLYDDEGNANPDISATPEGYKVSPELFYEIAANIEGVDVKAALKRLSFK